MAKLSGNYFKLSDPDRLSCYVHSLRTSLPVLIVHVKQGRGKAELRLSFSTPIYFEGPMEWTSANFQIGATQELVELWKRFWKDKVDQEVFLRNYRLFKVPSQADTMNATKVRIIAVNARIVEHE
jgi:hypothetical protein